MTAQHAERIPKVTLGWRMRMAMEGAKIKRPEMAAIMDVHEGTITRWCRDEGAPPKRPIIIQWALATNVSLGWLETGEAPAGGTPGGGQTFLEAADDGPNTVVRSYHLGPYPVAA